VDGLLVGAAVGVEEGAEGTAEENTSTAS